MHLVELCDFQTWSVYLQMLGWLLAKEQRVRAVNREQTVRLGVNRELMVHLGVVLECMFRLVLLEE